VTFPFTTPSLRRSRSPLGESSTRSRGRVRPGLGGRIRVGRRIRIGVGRRIRIGVGRRVRIRVGRGVRIGVGRRLPRGFPRPAHLGGRRVLVSHAVARPHAQCVRPHRQPTCRVRRAAWRRDPRVEPAAEAPSCLARGEPHGRRCLHGRTRWASDDRRLRRQRVDCPRPQCRRRIHLPGAVSRPYLEAVRPVGEPRVGNPGRAGHLDAPIQAAEEVARLRGLEREGGGAARGPLGPAVSVVSGSCLSTTHSQLDTATGCSTSRRPLPRTARCRSAGPRRCPSYTSPTPASRARDTRSA
jgi:hypothetical protein